MIRNFDEAQYFINVCTAPNNEGLAELKSLIWSSPSLSDIRDLQGNSLAHMAIQSGNDEVLKKVSNLDTRHLPIRKGVKSRHKRCQISTLDTYP